MGEWKQDGLTTLRRVVLAHEPAFRLGKLSIHPPTRQVEADGRSETLEPRVMQVLVALAHANGAIVTRDELTESCWEGRVIGEDALNRALSRVRHVAANIGGESFKVETIPKVGYRLVGDRGSQTNFGQVQTTALARSLCVLPFANMSGDATQEYFSDGISEDITTDLSKVSGLEVTARNTAFTFKGKAADVCAAARKLGVSHVLEGSVQKAGNRVRISAQLIDGVSGNHIWAERYDRDLTDIFAIQDEISQAIVTALKLKLLPSERDAIGRRGTASAEAYDLCLMARKNQIAGHFCDRPREEAVVRLCKRATELDPEYARAWAMLALAQGNLFRAYSVEGSTEDGSAAAERALAIDPNIPEARLPKAWRLALDGHSDQANAELAIALALDPESWEVNWEAGRLFFRQRQMSDAARCFAKAAEKAQGDFHCWGMLAACYTALGNGAGLKQCAAMLVQQVQEVLAHDPDNGSALAFGALSFAVLGQTERSREWVERAQLLDADNLYMRYTLGWTLATTSNDARAAIDLLEPFLTMAREIQIWLAANDPNLDSLRGDPRFQRLMQSAIDRVGLPRAAITDRPVV